jgi:hypothetical protein
MTFIDNSSTAPVPSFLIGPFGDRRQGAQDMARSHTFGWYLTGGLGALVVAIVAQAGLATLHAQQSAPPAAAVAAVTFTKDIANPSA